MKAHYYLEISIPCATTQGGTSPQTVSMAMKAIHVGISRSEEALAMALPDYSKRSPLGRIRIFAQTSQALERFKACTEPFMSRIGVTSSEIIEVPRDFQGPWHAFLRYRIPTRTSDRHEGAPLRQRRMLHAENARMPHFSLISTSNGNGFRIIVERVPAAPDADGHVNSYGLSLTASHVAIPDC